jgi:hypothetical protein
MWSGAIRRLLERVVMGEVAAKPEAAAAFALRWNLRGLGVKQREIEAAVERAVETYISGQRGDSRD